MNKELNSNTRTLIVSFVVAIMVMIPLRFVEVGQMTSQAQVLGESDIQVQLPNAKVEEVKPKLEAPYDEIETKVLGEKTVTESKCLSKAQSNVIINDLKNQIQTKKLNAVQLKEFINQLIAVEENVCK